MKFFKKSNKNKFREKDPHILIIVITKDKVEPECMNALLAQDYESFSIMVHSLKSHLQHSDRIKNAVINIVRNRNMTRRMALASDADFFWLVDCDVVPPPTALSSLILQQKDFMGGWYHAKEVPPNMPTRWPTAVLQGHIAQYFDKPANSVHMVDFTGLGCVLVSRRLFEKVEFRDDMSRIIQTNFGEELFSDDSSEFCFDAARLGHRIYMNGDVVCGHVAHTVGEESYPRVKVNPIRKKGK